MRPVQEFKASHGRETAERTRVRKLWAQAVAVDRGFADYLHRECSEQIDRRGYLPDSDEARELRRLAAIGYAVQSDARA